MPAEKDLDTLLSSLSPELLPEPYVFCTVNGVYGDFAALSPLASFIEKEGMTLILTRQAAQAAGLPFTSVFRAITLTVHSSLDAVGLTAAVSGILAANDISANVVAAYYHDHIFVPETKADKAMELLQNIGD